MAKVTFRIARPQADGIYVPYRGRPTHSLSAAQRSLLVSKMNEKGEFDPSLRAQDRIARYEDGKFAGVVK